MFKLTIGISELKKGFKDNKRLSNLKRKNMRKKILASLHEIRTPRINENIFSQLVEPTQPCFHLFNAIVLGNGVQIQQVLNFQFSSFYLKSNECSFPYKKTDKQL
jgi:ribonuclease HII